MKSFRQQDAGSLQEAAALLAQHGPKARLIAGGSDLLHLMKDRIVTPEILVRVESAPLASITEDAQGVKIGAFVTLSDLERNPLIRQKFPFLAEAAGQTASPQIRNRATLGGNLCQRPWCWYFRGPLFSCLRKGGGICYASFGESQYHAILDGGPCYIVHPSDLASPLLALESKVKIEGHQKRRLLPLQEFFVRPSSDVTRENVLEPDELVTEIQIPPLPAGAKGVYFKERERRSWDHALVGITAILALEDGACRDARISLSGVAPTPFRATAAEEMLTGKKITEDLCVQAAEAALHPARPLAHNRYKVLLAKTLIRRAAAAVG